MPPNSTSPQKWWHHSFVRKHFSFFYDHPIHTQNQTLHLHSIHSQILNFKLMARSPSPKASSNHNHQTNSVSDPPMTHSSGAASLPPSPAPNSVNNSPTQILKHLSYFTLCVSYFVHFRDALLFVFRNGYWL